MFNPYLPISKTSTISSISTISFLPLFLLDALMSSSSLHQYPTHPLFLCSSEVPIPSSHYLPSLHIISLVPTPATATIITCKLRTQLRAPSLSAVKGKAMDPLLSESLHGKTGGLSEIEILSKWSLAQVHGWYFPVMNRWLWLRFPLSFKCFVN
jgi:hypothetical protein